MLAEPRSQNDSTNPSSINAPSIEGPPEVPQEPLPVYVTFGKFQLLARLGKGGMGDVFLASMKGLQGFNKLVVVKRLREALTEDEDMRQLFLAEGRLAARLNHPNVVQTNEVGEEQATLYLSMEYLEGQPLSEINRKLGANPLDPVLAARIVSEALAGLHYAHELQDYDATPLHLVHRDVSPQNIFITYEGITKVVDFGIAKVAWQVGNKTQDGVLKGKVAYMAPEHVSGSPDRRSDIFSMGVVLWELIARRRLMADTSVARVLHRVMTERPNRVSTIVPDVDSKLDDVIARALEKDPDERFQTAQEMRDALEEYIADSGRFVRQEDVAQLLQSLFKSRRERVRKQVQASMKAATETHSLAKLPPLSKKVDGATTSASRSGTLTRSEGSSSSDVHATNTGVAAAQRAERQRPLRYRASAAVVAVLGALSLVVGMKTRRTESPSVHSVQLKPVVTREPTVAAVAAVAPVPEPVAAGIDDDSFEVLSASETSKKSNHARHASAHMPAPAPAPSHAALPPPSVATSTPVPESSAAATPQPHKRKFRTEF